MYLNSLQAQTISLTVAQMFNNAFQIWQLNQEQLSLFQKRRLSKVENQKQKEDDIMETQKTETIIKTNAPPLIDLDLTPTHNNWVRMPGAIFLKYIGR